LHSYRQRELAYTSDMNDTPIMAPIVALLISGFVIWALHKLKRHPVAQKYLNQNIIDWVTTGIVIYVLCVWVIGSLTTLIVNRPLFVF